MALSGVFSVCSDEKPDLKWIVFDGPVDTLWIESMNYVMVDNKILTLISGEHIAMPDLVCLLFEAEDLAVASPATISRCGMVYNDTKNLGWKPFLAFWLRKRQKVLNHIRTHMHTHTHTLWHSTICCEINVLPPSPLYCCGAVEICGAITEAV